MKDKCELCGAELVLYEGKPTCSVWAAGVEATVSSMMIDIKKEADNYLVESLQTELDNRYIEDIKFAIKGLNEHE